MGLFQVLCHTARQPVGWLQHEGMLIGEAGNGEVCAGAPQGSVAGLVLTCSLSKMIRARSIGLQNLDSITCCHQLSKIFRSFRGLNTWHRLSVQLQLLQARREAGLLLGGDCLSPIPHPTLGEFLAPFQALLPLHCPRVL